MNRNDVQNRLNRIKLLALDVDGVLTNGQVSFDTDGRELKTFSFKDIMGISRLKKEGVPVALVSGEKNSIVDKFAEKMKIEKVYQGCREKDKALDELSGNYNISLEEICFVGDDVNDISALIKAGLAVTVPNAFEEVKNNVDWITNRHGGDGAVREICEMIIASKKSQGQS